MNVGTASTTLKSSLEMVGIPSSITRRASIIAYEVEMNLVIHAGGGIIRSLVSTDKLMILAIDEGPGIPDIDLAMQEGYSTASDAIRELGFGAGMGLSNMKRNADVLKINSEMGKGTSVEAIIYFTENTEWRK
ncbi:MAG: anti-sigma regulatory factor [Synergistales bacterium]|nr:anti-sigma regulatory factor [Synergistales bacterium]